MENSFFAGLLAIGLGTCGMSIGVNNADAQTTGAVSEAQFDKSMETGKLECPLDMLLQIPEVWKLTPDKLDAAFKTPEGVSMERSPYFEWLTESRERAHFVKQRFVNFKVNLTLFGGEVRVNEVTVDFLESGKLNGIIFSIMNRSDPEDAASGDFEKRYKRCGRELSKMLDVRPFHEKPFAAQPIQTESWFWGSVKGVAIIEYNPRANKGVMEFLKVRIAPRDAKGNLVASMDRRHTAVGLNTLPENVQKSKDGDIWIKGIPMVDQGLKGYCVVASCQRLFEYYGIPCDQHQIAQIADADAASGTSAVDMSAALDRIDYRFKMRFNKLFIGEPGGQKFDTSSKRKTKPAFTSDFEKELVESIDDGIPLLWALAVGLHEENPPLLAQTAGYHMRLIIGYNKATKEVIFSDTWGRGHEKKRMKLADAWDATTGIYTMQPTTR
ncbi:MAG: hypothetical protein ACI9R3_004787 [Verrucomicrobiales bacterium]|jgi:hypothetical protein